MTATALLLEAFGRHRDLAAELTRCPDCKHSLHAVTYPCYASGTRFVPTHWVAYPAQGAHMQFDAFCPHCTTGDDPPQQQPHPYLLRFCQACRRWVPIERTVREHE